MAQLLVAGAVGLVALWVVGKYRASRAPERMAKAGAVVTTIGRLLLGVPIVWAAAAMAEGCEDDPPGPSAPAIADGVDGAEDGDGRPERVTCGSWREEDCPPYPSVLVPSDGAP